MKRDVVNHEQDVSDVTFEEVIATGLAWVMVAIAVIGTWVILHG